MKYKLRDCGVILIFVILLPYVFTVLAQGRGGAVGMADESGEVPEAGEEYITLAGGRKLPFGDYLMGVVIGSIPADTGEEAIKAQMVIARTTARALLERGESGSELGQNYVEPETLRRSMGYQGFQKFYAQLKRAEEETRGQVLTCRGELIDAAFHAVSAGKTRAVEEGLSRPYLQSVDSPWDMGSRQYLTITYLEKEEFLTGLSKLAGRELKSEEDPLSLCEIEKRDGAGYVERILVDGNPVGGEEFRAGFGLHSACFYLDEFDGKVRVTVKGLGHGAGLSLYGANEMAKEGKSYREILGYYYKNTEISRFGE